MTTSNGKFESAIGKLRAPTLLLLAAGFMLLGRAAWANPLASASPAQKYQSGVECVGYYDFGLSMMPASASNRTDIQNLRAGWLDYAKTAKTTQENVIKMDISKARDKTENVAMSGDRQKVGAYMTALNSQCETLPLDPSAPSPSNPFGFETSSDLKTYVAAMQCAGKYVVKEGSDSQNTLGFTAMAKTAKPNISKKMLDDDLTAATLKSMNITISADLTEFAALDAQCKTALPFLP